MILGVLFGIICLLSATAAGLGLIHINHGLYTVCLNRMDIPEISGYSEGECIQNYDAVMEFLAPFNHEKFDLPTMTYSESGAQHFEDCRPLFNGVYLLGTISLAIALISGPIAKRKFGAVFLKTSGITTIAVPSILLCAFAVDFNAAFVLFHKIFFSNDMWLFDPATDPIINILPEDFFLVCGVFIAVFWILSAVIQLICSKRMKKDNV